MHNKRVMKRCRWSFALGASIGAMTIASTASAQCAPNPTVANGTTTCTGVEEQGLSVPTSNTQVIVAPDAIVRAGASDAAITISSNSDYIQVNGAVDGGSKPGFLVTGNPFGVSEIAINAGGSVSGSTAFVFQRNEAVYYSAVRASLGNSGNVTASNGAAVVANDIGAGSIMLYNYATGTIDGIAGQVSYISNQGLIRGGSGSAISAALGTAIYNSKQITSTGPAATIAGAGVLSVTNYAGAFIGGGTTAISASGALSLVNAGTITGSVVSTATVGQNSVIDTRDGTITGNLILGSGDDTLRARFDILTGTVNSIGGTVDGGAGNDTLAIGIDADATLGTVPLPTNFELLGLDLSNNATVTLSPAFTNAGVSLTGTGLVINQAALVSNGPAVVEIGFGPAFTNQGSITAALTSGQFAVGVSFKVTNVGSIVGNGGGGVQANYAIANSGSIEADETAAAIGLGSLNNTGSIASRGGTGASIYGYGDRSINTGTIDGATIGLTFSNTALENSGSITGGTAGVSLGYAATLINDATGVITGGGAAAIVMNSIQTRIVNAGTINGDVDLRSPYGYDFSDDVFVDNGGTVNGAIRLGGGNDQLVVDLADVGARPLGGATGGVDAGDGYDTLRYRVNADAAVGLSLIGGFEALAFELDNDAGLTLTAADPQVTTLGLTGNGTVTLNGSLVAIDHTVLDATIPTADQLTGGGAGPAQNLTIVNNGDLTLTATQQYSYPPLAAIAAGNATVVNNGNITVSSAAGSYYPASGIFGGTAVTNNGTITLTGGGTAISGAPTVVNTGVIYGAPGANIMGVTQFNTLANSGSIEVDGAAVQGNGYYYSSDTITNSGSITSRTGTAVTLGYGTLTNEATGTIRGVIAVDPGTGTIVNRGAIVGDVASSFSYYTFGGASFVQDGGTVTGNVTFGQGNDQFIVLGDDGTGVSGTIDGGGGNDLFGRVLTGSATASLDPAPGVTGFEDALVRAASTDTVATVTAATPFAGNLYVNGAGTVVNTATIQGQVSTAVPYPTPAVLGYVPALATFDNRGVVRGSLDGGIGSLVNSGTLSDYVSLTDALSITNSGTISTRDEYQPALSDYLTDSTTGTLAIVNSGTIEGLENRFYSVPGITIDASSDDRSATVTNTLTGTIQSTGFYGAGIYAYNVALHIDNAGTIAGGNPYRDIVPRGDAILVDSSQGNTVTNSGTIAGFIELGNGGDRVENTGTIDGNVYLYGGDDTYVQRAGATLTGFVDGGTGLDTFVVDATGDGALSPDKFADFERLVQTGSGTVNYAGSYGVDTIELQGGTLAVAAGQTLATQGPITITGGDAGVSVSNAGTIAGRVAFGAGNDSYTELPGSLAVGGVDGGAGTDLYRVVLAGDRTGIGARTGFEQLSVEGSGTLSLTLDQNFQSVALAGTGLDARLAGFTVGRIDGSAAAERVTLDGDVGAVSLGAGDDVLSLGATTAAGRYDGGPGSDLLRFTAPGAITLTGTVAGFENLSLAGNVLVVAGTLGASGDTLAFGAGDQSLTVARGGTLLGTIDLGAGNDAVRIAAGGSQQAALLGGTGNDTLTMDVAGTARLATPVTGFEQLVTQGSGTLTLAGQSFAFDNVSAATSLTVATDAMLRTGTVTFGPGDQQLTIAGGFAGSVAGGNGGGGGSDSVVVSRGSSAAPVAFANATGLASYQQTGGYATVSGSLQAGSLALTGGQLSGLAGSTIAAPTITVGQGATFGSGGVVNGNLAVAGTLSPGAPIGTMIVNGNVALTAGSTSLFQITPTSADKLQVSGTLAIAQGATLQLTADQGLQPGRSVQLITAGGGITGSYGTVVRSGSLFGFVVQQANSISLLGAFLNDAANPQVSRSIDYVNGLLTGGTASPALLAAAPNLVNANGTTNQAAFALLTPEAYASARQITVENGLTLAAAARGDAFATRFDDPGFFTFASGLGSTRTIAADTQRGTSRARTDGYGVLGGIGYGTGNASIGAFVGYLDGRQRLAGLGARTDADGIVAGIHGRWSDGAFGIKATIAYDGADAETRRIVPGGGTTRSRYDLHGWTGDLSISYAVPLGSNWIVRPTLGATAIRGTRDRAVETGSAAFALDVARQRYHAVFVDGGLTFSGGVAPAQTFRPYLSLGVRYQADGRVPYAVAGFGGGGYGLIAAGAPRAPVLAHAVLGADLAVSSQLTLFGSVTGEAGDADRRVGALAGARLRF